MKRPEQSDRNRKGPDFGPGYEVYGKLLRLHDEIAGAPGSGQASIMALSYLDAPEPARINNWMPKAEDMAPFSERLTTLRGLWLSNVVYEQPDRLHVTLTVIPKLAPSERIFLVVDGRASHELTFTPPAPDEIEQRDVTFAVDIPQPSTADFVVCEICTASTLLFFCRLDKNAHSDINKYRFQFASFADNCFRLFVRRNVDRDRTSFRYLIDDRLFCSLIERVSEQQQHAREIWELPIYPRMNFRTLRRVKLLGSHGDSRVARGEFLALESDGKFYWLSYPVFDGAIVSGTIVCSDAGKEALSVALRTATGDVRGQWPCPDRPQFRFKKGLNSYEARWEGPLDDLIAIVIGVEGGGTLVEIPAALVRPAAAAADA